MSRGQIRTAGTRAARHRSAVMMSLINDETTALNRDAA